MMRPQDEQCKTCADAGKGCYWDGVSCTGKQFHHRSMLKKLKPDDDEEENDELELSDEELIEKSKSSSTPALVKIST